MNGERSTAYMYMCIALQKTRDLRHFMVLLTGRITRWKVCKEIRYVCQKEKEGRRSRRIRVAERKRCIMVLTNSEFKKYYGSISSSSSYLEEWIVNGACKGHWISGGLLLRSVLCERDCCCCI